MEASQLRRVTYVDCPECHRTEALPADKNSLTRSFSCPYCHHLWDTTEAAHEERARLNRRTTELRKEDEVSRDTDRDLDRRVAKLVAHVRHTLALLNQEARERFFKRVPPQ